MKGWDRLHGAFACAGVGVLALVSHACAETSCEETRTCPAGNAGDGGGSGGTGATGATGGFSGTGAGGAGGAGGTQQTGTFSISVAQSAVELVQGSSVELVVSVKRDGLSGPITIDLLGLPPGVTSSPVVANGPATSVNLTILAAANVVHSTTKVTVHGVAGLGEETAQFDLSVRGEPGAIDNSFGVAGEVTVNVYGEWSRAHAFAVAPDGKIYVAGETGSSASNSHAYFLSRYLAAGKVDSSFGTNGTVVRYDTANTGEHVLRGVVLDAQQRPVVAGYFTGNLIHVARFDTGGTLDPAFGTAGEVTGPGGNAYAIALHGPKLIAAGKDDKTPAHAVVGQLDADGKPDVLFGTQSFATADTGTNTSEAVAVGVDAENKVVLAGNTSKAGEGVLVARFKPDGSADTFGTSGIAWLTAPGAATGLAVRPDKRVVVAGGASLSNYFLIQLDALGAKDASFGTGGTATGSAMRIDAITLDASGRIVAAGRSGPTLVIGRFTAAGAPDASVATSGFATSTSKVLPRAITMLPDGRALVVGVSQAASLDKIYLARFWM